ncbi:MAG: SMC-Scp complex subunit ScpB [Patescibacteria group bacterium]
MENNSPKIAELEVLLFHYGEPLPMKKISRLIGVKESECKELVGVLASSLQNNEYSGLMILEDGDAVQLVSKPGLASVNEKLTKEEFREELTPAGLEALTIIAYLGPIPRMTLDYIRGVNSSFTLRALLMRGLIERSESAKRKNIYEYKVSFDFLKHMGLGSIQELPEYEKYKDILSKFDVPQIA